MKINRRNFLKSIVALVGASAVAKLPAIEAIETTSNTPDIIDTLSDEHVNNLYDESYISINDQKLNEVHSISLNSREQGVYDLDGTFRPFGIQEQSISIVTNNVITNKNLLHDLHINRKLIECEVCMFGDRYLFEAYIMSMIVNALFDKDIELIIELLPSGSITIL